MAVRKTAGHHHHRIGSGLAQGKCTVQHVTTLPISLVGNRAAINDIDIGSIAEGNNPIACVQKLRGESIAFVLIELASEGAEGHPRFRH